MTSEAVDLHFTYTEAEIVSALRLSYRRIHRIITKAVISFVAIVIGLIGIMNQSGKLLWYMLFLIGIVMLALYSFAYFYGPRQRVKERPSFSDRYHVTFSNENIIFRTDDVQTQFNWSYYQEAWELSNSYLLLPVDKSFTLIPKRAFSDEEQERSFRLLLNSHLGEVIKIYDQSIKEGETSTKYVPKSLEPPDWR